MERDRSAYLQKKEAHELLLPFHPQAIFITSGSIVERGTGEDVRFSSTAFFDGDARGLLAWGKAKVVAGAELARRFPESEIVALTRSSNNTTPYSDADVMVHELARFGIKKDIHTIHSPIDTFSELVETGRRSIEESWKQIAVVVTTFQEPRAQAMLHSLQHIDDPEEYRQVTAMCRYQEHKYPDRVDDTRRFQESIAFLQQNQDVLRTMDIAIVSAEDILPLRHPYYKKIVQDAQNHPLYREKTQRDADGVAQWKRKEYGKIH